MHGRVDVTPTSLHRCDVELTSQSATSAWGKLLNDTPTTCFSQQQFSNTEKAVPKHEGERRVVLLSGSVVSSARTRAIRDVAPALPARGGCLSALQDFG